MTVGEAQKVVNDVLEETDAVLQALAVSLPTTGDRIKELRIRKKMSQEELGRAVGLKQAAIHKYENNLVVNRTRSVIENLAKALDTTSSFLMGWNDPRPRDVAEALTKALQHFGEEK